MSKIKTNKYRTIFQLLFLTLLSCLKTPKDEEGGEILSMEGYNLYVKDKGSGEPTVIIENGLACKTLEYDDLQKNILQYTRVISYDHAGIGRSRKFIDRLQYKISKYCKTISLDKIGVGKTTMKTRPRTLANYAEELRALLNYKHLAPPYILVGHSMGGFFIRYYAHLYPEEVAGLVFIEAIHEDWLLYMRSHHTMEELINFNNFWEPEKSSYTGGDLIELSYYKGICDSIRGIKVPPDIPVKMYTGTVVGEWANSFGYTPKDMQVWAELQHSTLDGVNDVEHFIDEKTGHRFHIENPLPVENGIKELVNEYRQKINKRLNETQKPE
ncbi:MAG: alpha/beta hydrolase [Candidatus Latescibacteria bacterium]|nr:alpha/beta hydrolase [Candidatus Latescibacterota bacterium]